MKPYHVGDNVRIWGTFKAASWSVTAGVPSAAYALADPTTVTLTVRTPSGVSTSYTYALSEVTRHGLGVFYKELALAESGTYRYKWASTGAVVAATDGAFRVEIQET